MLDIALLEQILVDGPFARGVENLLLQHGMNRQLETDLARQPFLAPVALCTFKFFEQLLDLAVVLLQQCDRVH